MVSHIIKWMLTASMVISGITSAEEDGKMKDQFQNWFDSIAKKNSISNGEIYHNTLKQKVEQERQTFHEMKNEIHMAHNKMFGNVENVGMAYKNVTKRQSQTVLEITSQFDTDFELAVLEKKIIIDKTKFITKLLLQQVYRRSFIMLRPYRFGKSFFLSMLRAFFKGKKHLFCSSDDGPPKMNICNNRDLTWEEYPILSLNFATIKYKTSISTLLSSTLCDLVEEKKYGIECNVSALVHAGSNKICSMFKAIYEKANNKKIVILIDEYDLPIIRVYFEDEAATVSRIEDTETFFSILKECSPYIHFLFIFGATKVTTIGATQNFLHDLTHDQEYTDMLGFTKNEILNFYKVRLSEVVRDKGLKDSEELFERHLIPHYDSYLFTESDISVFNPRSVTEYLKENPPLPKPYWAEEVLNRKLLMQVVEKFPYTTIKLLLDGIRVSQTNMEELVDRTKLMEGDETELIKILFQTGFISIVQGSNKVEPDFYDLKVVNGEARYILRNSLKELVAASPLREMEDKLLSNKFEEFAQALDKAISDLTGDRYFELETHYERIISFILETKKHHSSVDLKNGFVTSIQMSQVAVGIKRADYVKIVPYSRLTVIFSLKRYVSKEGMFNTTSELQKCLGTYVKDYANKNPSREIMCIVLIFYSRKDQKTYLRNERLKNTKYKYIMDWASLKWIEKSGSVDVYNIHPELNSDQLKELAGYNKKDQHEKQILQVKEFLAPAAVIFKDEVLSFEEFVKLIENCKNPERDAVEQVSKITENTDSIIRLIDKCYKLISNGLLKDRLTKIKNALEK